MQSAEKRILFPYTVVGLQVTIRNNSNGQTSSMIRQRLDTYINP
jgi:hypothetical protein